MSKRFDSAENDLPPNPPAQASGEQLSSEEILNDETTRGNEREQHISDGEQAKRTTARSRRRREGARAMHETRSEATPEGIIQLPARSEAQEATQDDEAEAVAQLQSQGFTPDEAIRLVHVSGRAATSREAREAEATLRRLRFTRWLIEHGMLDEFSA